MQDAQQAVNSDAIADLLKIGAAQSGLRTVGTSPFVVIPKDHQVGLSSHPLYKELKRYIKANS